MNIKTELEVYSELQDKMALIQNLMKNSDDISVTMSMKNVHLVELFDLNLWLQNEVTKFKYSSVEMVREKNKFVIKYKPQPKVLLSIYSIYINEN